MKVLILTALAGGLLFTTPLIADHDLSLSEVPKAVRAAVQQGQGKWDIHAIQKLRHDDKSFYQVTLKRKGQQRSSYYSEDGKRIGDIDAFIAGTEPARPPATEVAGFQQHLRNTTKVAWQSVPGPARQAIEEHARGARIEDIDRGTIDGKTVYEVAYKKDGVHTELRVSESGELLEELTGDEHRVFTEAAGAEDLGLIDHTPAFGSMKVKELPRAVQLTLKREAGSAPIEDIDRISVGGQIAYEVGFKRDGKHTEVRVAEDGKVLD